MRNDEINITLEQALEKSSPRLKRMIEHSVEVVRKGYALWERFYKDDLPISLAFSAGKDSQALYHVAKIALTKEQWDNVDVFMSLTSVDPAPVIRFLKKEYPSVRRDMPKKSIFQMAIEHQMLPTMRVRWCCVDMKENRSTFSFIGIRREESAKRAKRNEVELMNHVFSGDFETLESYREEKVAKMKRQKKYKDYFDEHEESEVGCMGGKDRMTISPILHWTERDVWEFLNDVVGATHCELYDQGQHRIGCLCCPMSPYSQKITDIKKYPHVKERWIWAIKQIRNFGGGVLQSKMDTTTPIRDTSSEHRLCGTTSCVYMFKDGHIWLNKNYPPPPLPQMRQNQTYKDVMGFQAALRLTAPMKSVRTILRKRYFLGGYQERVTKSGTQTSTTNNTLISDKKYYE